MTCSVYACFDSDSDRDNLIFKARTSGVEMKIVPDDYCDRAEFSGPVDNVKKIVEDNWQITPKRLPFDTLVKCVEIGAIIDGVEMWDEEFSDY